MGKQLKIILSIAVMILAMGNVRVHAEEPAESAANGLNREVVGEMEGEGAEGNAGGETPEEKKDPNLQVAPQLHSFYGEQFRVEVQKEGDGKLQFEVKPTEPSQPEEKTIIKKIDEEGTFEAVGVGTATILITSTETETYKGAVKEVEVVIAKAKPQITTKDVTLKYNQSSFQMSVTTDMEIKDENVQFSWTSLHPEIASVTAQGVVTIKQMGTAVFRVSSNATDYYEAASKDVKVTITSSFGKPVIKSSRILSNGLKIAWDPIAGAEGYEVHRKDSKGWKIVSDIRDPQTTSYTDTKVTVGKTYYYRIKVYSAGGLDLSEWSGYKKMAYILPPSVSVSGTSSGLQIKWNKSAGAEGYYVYRRENDEKTWSRRAKLTSGSTLLWKDQSVSGGKKYTYMIRAYRGDSVSVYSVEKSYYRLSAPKITKWTRKSKTKMYLKWKKTAGAQGYQIQYSRSSAYRGTKTITVTNPGTTAKTITGLAKNKKYYPRVRAYATVDGKKYYSPWYLTKKAKSQKRASLSLQKRKKKTFELRGQAKQALYQYDTVQGGCSDGKYAYYTLYNRKVEKCKIAKVRLSDMKVIKVSGVLKIAHGNDLTYNSKLKRLVVVHSTQNPNRLSLIHPSTLKVEKSKDVKLPSALPGASSSDIKGMKGISAIAYNSTKNQYAVLLSKTANILILDGNMEPVTYIKPSKKISYKMQGIEATKDYILVGQSPKAGTGQRYNIISIYDWEGNYISRVLLKKGYELENIFYKGNQLYASFYRSYYKTYNRIRYKFVRKQGILKRKKIKVKYRKLMRDNYVYKVAAF